MSYCILSLQELLGLEFWMGQLLQWYPRHSWQFRVLPSRKPIPQLRCINNVWTAVSDQQAPTVCNQADNYYIPPAITAILHCSLDMQVWALPQWEHPLHRLLNTSTFLAHLLLQHRCPQLHFQTFISSTTLPALFVVYRSPTEISTIKAASETRYVWTVSPLISAQLFSLCHLCQRCASLPRFRIVQWLHYQLHYFLRCGLLHKTFCFTYSSSIFNCAVCSPNYAGRAICLTCLNNFYSSSDFSGTTQAQCTQFLVEYSSWTTSASDSYYDNGAVCGVCSFKCWAGTSVSLCSE